MMRDDLELQLARWLEEGPDRAPDTFVDATFAPIPYVPQRSTWRVRLGGGLDRPMGRLTGPVRLVAIAAALVIVLAAAMVVGIGGRGLFAGPPPTPSPSPTPPPSFSLTIAGGPGPGTYASVADPGISECVVPDAGSWRFLYAGGSSPFIGLDLLVGDGLATLAGSERVAAEIELTSPDAYVRFDPGILRGGDHEGRSSASVVVEATASSVTITVHALTPDRTSGQDGEPVTIDLTVTCPR